MKCVIRGEADTAAGKTSVLLQRGELSLVVNNVPALAQGGFKSPLRIPRHAAAGEFARTAAKPTPMRSLPSKIPLPRGSGTRLLREAEKMVKAGTKADVREYAVEGQ